MFPFTSLCSSPMPVGHPTTQFIRLIHQILMICFNFPWVTELWRFVKGFAKHQKGVTQSRKACGWRGRQSVERAGPLLSLSMGCKAGLIISRSCCYRFLRKEIGLFFGSGKQTISEKPVKCRGEKRNRIRSFLYHFFQMS